MTRPKLKDFGKMFENQKTASVKKTNDLSVSSIRKQTLFRMNETAIKQLDFMAIEMDKTRQDLLIEAVNDLFRKYKKPPIA